MIFFQYPNLYQPGRKSLFFNYGQFTISALQGFLTSMVLFMIPMGKFLLFNEIHPTALAAIRYANAHDKYFKIFFPL